MKKMLVVASALLLVTSAVMAEEGDLNPSPRVKMPINTQRLNRVAVSDQDGNYDGRNPIAINEGDIDVENQLAIHATAGGNLVNHGGPVMPNARVVCIFWGSSWSPSNSLVKEIQSFRTSSVGLLKHTNMLGQYGASQSNLNGQADIFDPTNPSSTRVTDAMVQAEVKKWFAGNYNYSTIYEVFIPSGYYSYDSGDTSCGGTNLQYCAYHSSFANGSNYVKYSIEPYPSCSGCQVSGWTTAQNAEHFMVHETREAMTDALGNAWYDNTGYEADDKCAWTSLFTEAPGDGHTYGYQPEWSNSARACVK